MTASISRASEGRVIAALVVLAGVLRLVHLGAQSLWVDEMLTLIVATPKPGHPLGQLLLHNIHGPLHAFVVALVRMASEQEVWLRLPSAIAGTLSVPLLHAWLRPRFGARVALLAAGLLAINPLHIHYSQELRNYAFAVMFVLAGCAQLDRAMAGWSRGRAIGLAACIAAALLSNFSAFFAFVVQSIAWMRSSRGRRANLARWSVVTALVVALTSPWLYRVTTFVDLKKLATPVQPGALDEAERLRGDTTFRMESVPYTFYAYSVGFSLGPSIRVLHADEHEAVARHKLPIAWTALVFGSLALAGLWRAKREGNWRAAELALYIAVPLVATLALNWQNAKAFNVRYVLIGLPMYLALVALGIDALARGWRAALAAALVLATCVASLANYYTDPSRRKEDVRAATRAIEARLQPGECIFAPTVWQIVAHYQTTSAPLHYVYGDNPAVTARQVSELFAACPSFWYLRARPWVDDPQGRVLSTIESSYARRDVLEFPGVTAIHFVRK